MKLEIRIFANWPMLHAKRLTKHRVNLDTSFVTLKSGSAGPEIIVRLEIRFHFRSFRSIQLFLNLFYLHSVKFL